MLTSGRFIRQLRRGHFGVKLQIPRSFRVLQKLPQGAYLGDLDHQIVWHFGLSPVRPDLCPDYEAELRADVSRATRFLFDQDYESFQRETESAGESGDDFTTALAKSYGPRTADPDWSPVVEFELLEIDSSPALKVIYRLAYRPGFETVVGHLLIPVEAGTLECTARCTDNTTGMRESMLFASLAPGSGSKGDGSGEGGESVDTEWQGPSLTQAEIDDPVHDDLVPFHCLTRARSALRWLLDPDGAAPQVLASAPSTPPGELKLSEAGVAITPPPRYVPVAPGLGKNLRSDMAVFARTSIPYVPPRTLDILRMATLRLNGPERKTRLEEIARSEPLGWVREGASGIDVETELLPDEDGQVHVASYIQYKVITGPTHTVAHWRADPDGAVFRIAVGGPPLIPKETLAQDADAVARSLRRLDG